MNYSVQNIEMSPKPVSNALNVYLKSDMEAYSSHAIAKCKLNHASSVSRTTGPKLWMGRLFFYPCGDISAYYAYPGEIFTRVLSLVTPTPKIIIPIYAPTEQTSALTYKIIPGRGGQGIWKKSLTTPTLFHIEIIRFK